MENEVIMLQQKVKHLEEMLSLKEVLINDLQNLSRLKDKIIKSLPGGSVYFED